MDGFTYNGRHTSEFGCFFYPDAEDRWFASPDFNVYDTDLAWADGGICYWKNYKPRTFALNCYFEDLTMKQREAIRRWLSPKSRGKLVIDGREFATYDVTPTKTVTGKLYTTYDCDAEGEVLYSGIFTVTFTAYEPFGVLDISTMKGRQACGMASLNWMTEPPEVTDTDFLVYNPGTKAVPMNIMLKGSAPHGVTLTNDTNQDKCVLLDLPDSPAWLNINAENGNITAGLENDTAPLSAFEFHDWGYIMLEPAMPSKEFTMTTTSGSNLATLGDPGMLDELIGKYVRIGGAWVRIANKSNGKAVLASNASSSGKFTTQYATLNRIMVSGTGLSLSGVKIDFTPRIE